MCICVIRMYVVYYTNINFSDSLDLLLLMAVDSDIKVSEMFDGLSAYNIALKLRGGKSYKDLLISGDDHGSFIRFV